MRDNRSSEQTPGSEQDCFGRLAQEALSNLVSARVQRRTEVRQHDLQYFMALLSRPGVDDPAAILTDMLDRNLDPEAVAQCYVPAAARVLGKQWEADEITFVDVTVRTERLHGIVRFVDELASTGEKPRTASCLILVPEGEQHTLGAFVLALQLRIAGFSAAVRIEPTAAELTRLIGGARFDVALISVGCETGLASAPALVKLLRRLAHDGLRIIVGGSSPLSDDTLLAASGADGVARDITEFIKDFGGTHVADGLNVRSRKA